MSNIDNEDQDDLIGKLDNVRCEPVVRSSDYLRKLYTLGPPEDVITIQQAADMLNVSTEYVIDLIVNQRINSHLIGNTRHIRYIDVLSYKKQSDAQCQKAVEELTSLSQECGFYDE